MMGKQIISAINRGASTLRMKPRDAYVYLKSGSVVHVEGLQFKGDIPSFLKSGETIVVKWQNGSDSYIPRDSIEMIHIGHAPVDCTCEGQRVCS